MKNIKIYSTPTCPYCITLKEFLEEHSIEFKDIDISKNKDALKEMIEKSGQMGTPVIDIDGEVIIGFEREKISKLLGIK